jgi:hypothetical protein
LPASAAVVTGLAGAIAEVDPGYLIAAGALLFGLVVFSTLFSGLKPYRLLLADRRGAKEHKPDRWVATPTYEGLSHKGWLQARIHEEEAIYGPLRTKQEFKLTLSPRDLQEALDVERWVLVIVDLCSAVIILELVVGLAFD